MSRSVIRSSGCRLQHGGRPPSRAIAYSTSAPSTAPSVEAPSAGMKASVPCATWKPASGSTSSDGIGGNTVSIAITTAMPA